MSWRDARFVAVNQAGLVEKFVDALVWILVPVYLYERGVALPAIGWIVGIYRFWRDIGYAFGATAIGTAAAFAGGAEAAFWVVAFAMVASGAVLAHAGPR